MQVGITRHETDNDGGMRERITPGVDINSAAKCDFNETEGSYMDQSVWLLMQSLIFELRGPEQTRSKGSQNK